MSASAGADALTLRITTAQRAYFAGASAFL
jgi:hypothetical protein